MVSAIVNLVFKELSDLWLKHVKVHKGSEGVMCPAGTCWGRADVFWEQQCV